ncbi:MAG: TusE/DsrC/DsvC family sulfur relay protein [Gammaproteobacteria bacterium]|jgi:tRNA 2-thiouridine synthesizing protein E
MTDIRQVIEDEHVTDPEKESRLKEVHGWNRGKSEQAAQQEGIELTEEHWKVIVFLRKHYVEDGPSESGRDLAQLLDKEFEKEGGLRYLYTLFPDGPVTQGSRVACLPIPPNSEDDSFGTAM